MSVEIRSTQNGTHLQNAVKSELFGSKSIIIHKSRDIRSSFQHLHFESYNELRTENLAIMSDMG